MIVKQTLEMSGNMTTWKKITDKQKDQRQYVLLSEDNTVNIGWWINGRWSYGGGYWEESKVTHYIDIPPPLSVSERKA